MAKEILPVDFKDDIMSESMEGRRRYRMIQNPDGTVSFEDTTEYDQIGSLFGQGQINKTNQAVNESLDKSRVIDNINDIASNSDTGYVMGALAGKELNQNLGGVNFISEGSGADVKYYAQLGADAASKKLLGNGIDLGIINAVSQSSIGARNSIFNISSVFSSYKNITKDNIVWMPIAYTNYPIGSTDCLSFQGLRLVSYDTNTGNIEISGGSNRNYHWGFSFSKVRIIIVY